MALVKKVALTEDRVESCGPVCQYYQCQAHLGAATVADGWNYCDEECWYAAITDEQQEPEEEEEEG